MSAEKAKGSAFERDVVRYLAEHGFPYAERRLAGAALDRGDIAGTPGICWECKSHARIDLPGFLAELKAEKQNAQAAVGVLVVKRRSKGVDQAYAVMPLADMCELLQDAGWGASE